MTKNTKRVTALLNSLQYMFGIQNYEREIILKKEESDALAEITTETDYQRITLKIYPDFFNKTKDEQRKALIHELCHTVLADSKASAYDLLNGKLVTAQRLTEINEEATSRFENILNSCLSGNRKQEMLAYKEFLSN